MPGISCCPPQAQRPGAADSTFRPISLADALRLAKENNVSNITAANAVRSSNLQVRSARAQDQPAETAGLYESELEGLGACRSDPEADTEYADFGKRRRT